MKKLGFIIIMCFMLASVSCVTTSKLVKESKQVDYKVTKIDNTNGQVTIKIKKGEESLSETVKTLIEVYGKPTMKVNAFRTNSGEFVIMKKMYFRIDEITFIIVSVVNDKILLIDTVHVPSLDKKE